MKNKVNIKNMFRTTGTRRGSYSVGLTVLAVAVVIVFNLIVGQIPEAFRNIDVSSTKIYEISDTTRDLLDSMDRDVDMKVLAEGQPLPSGWMKPRDSDIRDVIVPLFFHYDISESACRRVVTLKKLRNTRIAHGGGDLPMSQDELSEACVSVIFPMLEKDFTTICSGHGRM